MTIKHLAKLCVFASLTVAPASAQEVAFHADQFTVELGKMGVRVPIEARLVKGAPYSAEVMTESVQWLPDGNRIVQRSSARVYRDSEGRIRREEDRPSGAPAVSITDPVAGISFWLSTDNRLALLTPNGAAVNVVDPFHAAKTVVTRLPPGAAKPTKKGDGCSRGRFQHFHGGLCPQRSCRRRKAGGARHRGRPGGRCAKDDDDSRGRNRQRPADRDRLRGVVLARAAGPRVDREKGSAPGDLDLSRRERHPG